MKRRRGRRVVVVVARGEELRLGLRCGSTWREIATEGKGVFFSFFFFCSASVGLGIDFWHGSIVATSDSGLVVLF